MQDIFSDLTKATEKAIETSREKGETVIILSTGKYYVEDGTPFIRTWEKIIAKFKNGREVK